MIDEVRETTVMEMSKSQNIRLLDVFFIGPFIIYAGYKAKGLTELERYILYGIGVATILYNGKNYLKIKINGRSIKTYRNKRIGSCITFRMYVCTIQVFYV